MANTPPLVVPLSNSVLAWRVSQRAFQLLKKTEIECQSARRGHDWHALKHWQHQWDTLYRDTQDARIVWQHYLAQETDRSQQ